ncbi:trypsin-like peptidase domain-containing protein [Sutcliffiella horikoshii]|uniref:trypsin-like peptidase domain-containing protein n=1 Tax=Sutcliffiella horikoshii TaxID=79883 RepID=UPI001F1E82BA|nr:trypsin-like peptidase domain-containing protein [Sutcliffiella horikoshii]MCG1021437.1 trypsin-like serine protease [Sutcliffiella horikoshii]
MYCPKCGTEKQKGDRFCSGCGTGKGNWKLYLIFTMVLLLFFTVSGLVFIKVTDILESKQVPVQTQPTQTQQTKEVVKHEEEKQQPLQPVVKIEEPKAEEVKELTDIIAEAQQQVYTIFTDTSQGSGFLYNKEGIVVTNAHVVEGSVNVVVRTIQGTEHQGKVIGYSNEIDVAILSVPDFTNRVPIEMETEDTTVIGEEIIALGSPLGLENTATMGYITGTNRDFYIDNFIYEDLYQISAPISPGSSGGPLLSQKTAKIIAINSAEDTRDTNIGFSIPIYTIVELIEAWIQNPMSDQEIASLFYYADGIYYYDYLWELFEYGYFNGGYYSDESSYYEYWEYDNDWLYDWYIDEGYYYDEETDYWYYDYNEEEAEYEDDYWYYEENEDYEYEESDWYWYDEEEVEYEESEWYEEESEYEDSEWDYEYDESLEDEEDDWYDEEENDEEYNEEEG